jgi:hypothetical protein
MNLASLPVLLATLGLGFFLMPVLQRLRGGDFCDTRRGVRSPMWWAGVICTVAAIVLQFWLRRAGQAA